MVAGTACPGYDESDRNESCSAVIPATGRGSGIPFDRRNSVVAGSVASIDAPKHRRPVAVGKSGKRRVYTPAAPEGFVVGRSELRQRTGR